MFNMKLIALAVLATAGYFFFAVMFDGRRIAYGNGALVDRHESNTKGLLCSLVLAIALLECMVRVPGLHARPVSHWLLWTHLPFAAAFFVTFLLLKYRYTGRDRRGVHHWLTYVSATCFLVALTTGLVLLYQM